MHYLRQHILSVIETYDGSLPLTHFLKNYFRQHPKLGSRDRKILTAMAYGWYRIGKGVSIPKEDLISLWLSDPKKILEVPVTQWLNDSFDATRLFPYDVHLSDGITIEAWLRSMLTQPRLFIRIRKDKDRIIQLIEQNSIPYEFVSEDCLSLPNGAKIDTLLPANSYVVQDASSQYTGTFFNPDKNEQWYDCCSGAGGKSILLKDLEPSVKLSVSDVRQSIVHNLMERFRIYGLEQPTAYITNVADKEQLSNTLGSRSFDNIICDVPCSGSGTWARTPEQLYFFEPTQIAKFPPLQKTIATNVSQYLKPGGRLIYITCSVFKRENEDVIDAFLSGTQLKLLRSQIINGIALHADSMFVAELQKMTP